ncbi:SCP2 sterol-binding domain-containing protein [Actinomadura sp. NPDC047616]|uniref:SCP2 sterol-binding domain-containing protein n=1 Tax=Actinomadura sp. NPDC047616 TaxID=3155914 RepID=UPI0033E7C56D
MTADNSNVSPTAASDLASLLDQLRGADLAAALDQIDGTDLQRLAQDINTPNELRLLLEASGGDDELIQRFLAKAGADAMLDRVFTLMRTRFITDRLGSDSGTVEWHITTPEGEKVHHLTIGDGRAEGGSGPADKARVTLTMSAPDLLRLCAGTLEAVAAFMNGKIKLSGDMMFGARLPSLFDTSS